MEPDSRLEIELKLLAPPGTLDQLRAAPVVLQRARNKGIVRRLEAFYYDTPDRVLIRHGLSLRVRRNGKRHIQTLKLVSAAGNPLLRHEWEAPVETMAPNLSRLPRTEIGAPFDTLAGEALVPIFATKIRRHLQIIELPNAQVEIAFDDGAIQAGEQSEPVSEVELELKAGDVGALYEFGMSLLDVAPLHVGTSSKAERGYALAFDMPPVAVKAAAAGISAADNVNEAIAKLLRSCQRHLMMNLAAAQNGRDPEGVHQMRVALRRLRSALSILQRDVPVSSLHAVTTEARQLARVLGPARSWDVLVAELSKIDNAHLVDVDLDAVRRAAAKLRATSYAVARDALSDPRNSRFMLSLGLLLERKSWYTEAGSETQVVIAEPVTALARRALTRISRKAIRQGRHFRQLSPEARHKLRLTLKKLRYTTEFFLPLYGEQASARKYLKRLSKLQDVLGADHDVTMTRPLLHDIGQSTDAPDFHQAVGAIIGWQSRHRIEAARALQERWRSFEKATPFWSF